MTASTSNLTQDAARFPSLESLRAAHSELLKEFRTHAGTAEINERIEAFIRRGRATGALLDADIDRVAAQSQLDYWATQLYRPDYEPPDATLEEFDPQLAPELADELCPYVGLDAFRELNQSVFFGRAHLINELIRKLGDVHLLLVLGSSGSGKSSVVRAGLIPELKRGALPGSQDWTYFPPMVPGSNPLINLARLVLPAEASPAQVEIEADRFRQNRTYLAQLVSEKFTNNVVIVVDQFEEIFTLCTDEIARQRFVDNLIRVCQVPAAEHRVIITMRTDFEENLGQLPELQTMLEQAAIRVTALNASELREAIEAPAARIGLKFEEGLVDELLNITLGELAALPLLQFTLLKLWEGRERNRITWEAYRKLGSRHGALAHSADEVYNGLILEEQGAMRRILMSMVKIRVGFEVTSNRVRRAVLYQTGEARDRIDRVLDKLIAARLVRVSEGDIAADEQVEIAHEALVRNWPRLLEWLDEERDALRQRQRLTTAAEEWQHLGEDRLALWRGRSLEESRKYVDLNDTERKFLEASDEAEKTEVKILRERAAQLWNRAIYLTVALVVALIAVGVAAFTGTRAIRSATISRASELAAQSISRRNADFRASLLLGLEAFRHYDTFQIRGTLLDNVQANPQLRAYLDGHTGAVNSVAFSPNGKILASGSADHNVILWDVETRQPIGQPLSGHTDSVGTIAFSPDGRILASGSDDGTIILWDVKTRKPIRHPLVGPGSPVHSVAFSPDGKTLASGSDDGTIILWDVESGKPIGQSLRGQTGSVNSVAFSPECPSPPGATAERCGKTLASGSDDGTLILWDVETGKPIGQPLSQPNGSESSSSPINSVAFSPDGKTLVSGGGDKVSPLILWDLQPKEPIRKPLGIHGDWVRSVAFSPECASPLGAPAQGCGKNLASGGDDDTLILWDVETGEPIGEPLRGHTGSVNSVAFSPDGKTLASGSDDRSIILWDLEGTQQISQPLGEPTDYVRSIAFSPDGKTLVAGGWNDTFIVWDVAGRQLRDGPLSGNTGFVSSVAFSPECAKPPGAPAERCGKILATGGENGLLTLWDAETMQPVGQPLHGHQHWVSSIAFSPDGKTLASGSYDDTIILWDAETRQPIGQPLSGHTDWVRSVAFSPECASPPGAPAERCGKILASGSDDDTIILWNVQTGQPIGQPLRGHTDWVRSVAFSPDGKILASGSDDHTIILWDVQTGQPIGQPLRGHTDAVNSVAFSPECASPPGAPAERCGKILASGSDDHTIILWDVQTGQPIGQPLRGQTGPVSSVAFSPDGKTLASGGGDLDSTIILWDIDPGSWIQKTCQRAGRNFTRQEWAYYFPNEDYRATCSQWPLEPDPTLKATP